MATTYKVVLLGEGRVGKTSLISRFVNDKFDSEQASTVQASMYNKKKVQVDGKVVDLSIWDTAGQERFHALGPIYYRNSNGAVLVYDITDADTFEKVKMWIKELKAVVGDNICIVICGNKSDMERDRDIDEAIAVKYARKENALHFSTSAKLNQNVAEAFEALARSILQADGGGSGTGVNGDGGSGSAAGKRGAAASGGAGSRKKKGLRIDDDAEASGSGVPPPPPLGAASSSAKGSSTSANYDVSAYDDAPASTSTGAASPAADSSASGTRQQRSKTILLSERPSDSQTKATDEKGAPSKKSGGKSGCCS